MARVVLGYFAVDVEGPVIEANLSTERREGNQTAGGNKGQDPRRKSEHPVPHSSMFLRSRETITDTYRNINYTYCYCDKYHTIVHDAYFGPNQQAAPISATLCDHSL